MNTKEIQEAVCKWLVASGDESVCENYGHCWEMDIATLSNAGFISEFEVKISRSDFLADKKRKATKFTHFDMRNERTAPNYFYYVCPENLIAENEIPIYAGLYYCINGEMKLIKGAVRIHKAKADKEKVRKKMLRLNVQRKYLGCAMITYLNREANKKQIAWQKEQEEIKKQNQLNIAI